MTRRRRTQSGLTLIEMLIVVAIIGVMVGIAFPSITSGIDSLRIRSASDEIVSTFNSAMNRADRRQEPLKLSLIAWGTGCCSPAPIPATGAK